MKEFVLRYWLELVFSALAGAAVWALRRTQKKMKDQINRVEAAENGTRCLLRAEIIRSYDKYTERNYCPIYAREALEQSYQAYHDLGGNGTIKGLMNAIRALPFNPDSSSNEK